MSGIARTGRPLPARLIANSWADVLPVPARPAALQAMTNRLKGGRSTPRSALPLRSIANALIANVSIANVLIALVANRFPTNPLQTIQFMDGSFTPDRPPAAGLRPGLALAARWGTGLHRSAVRQVASFRGVQP